MKKYIAIPLFIIGLIALLIGVLELYSEFIEYKYSEYYFSETTDMWSFFTYMLAVASPAIYLLWLSLFSKSNLGLFKRKSLYTLVTLVLLSFVFEPVMNMTHPSDEYLARVALKLYRSGDYEAALVEFKKLDKNNLVSLAMMGKMYGKGRGVKVDYEKAIQLFQLPAEKDYTWARENLEQFEKNLEQQKLWIQKQQ